MKILYFTIIAISFLLCGCPAQPKNIVTSDNTNVKIELLASTEFNPGRNIDIYRISDGNVGSFYMVENQQYHSQ